MGWTVGGRGLGPRDQEEQRTQYHTNESTHTAAAAAAAAGRRAGLGCLVEKNTS